MHGDMKTLAVLVILAASLQPYPVRADSSAAAAASSSSSSSGDGSSASATAVAVATTSSSAHIPCNCDPVYRPVCGSDGITYSNVCILRCISEHNVENNRPPIHVKSLGECPHTPCRCALGGEPLCGSDGHTYGNLCLLNCENRRRELIGLPPIKVVHPGACRIPVCICPEVIIPVCGTDGRTYKNVCILQCVSRINQANGRPPIRVKKAGECAVENCSCPLNKDPICASDGNTYNNQCELRCQNRKRQQLGKPPLTVQYKGKCINCHCPKIYAPVCASNDVTFANTCALDCENRRRRQQNLPPLTIESRGVCPCICPLVYDPVCGTDDRTYGNRCQLRCENKRRTDLGLPRISVAHRGRCICDCWYCPRWYAPVCGSDGRTYWNRCWLNCNRGCNSDIGYRLYVLYDGPC
uniref:Kazal-like domain-containing protein n=1 Tax=Heliothis virescens TaxID=7102 RepID=A0A2A4JXB3_HELVI